MDVLGTTSFTPRMSSRKVKRHSLQPQIFLQLELASPQGKHIDPSKVGVLNSDWRDSPNALDSSDHHQFLTHVRVEHCNILPEECEIRNEGPLPIPDVPDLEHSESMADTEETSGELEISKEELDQRMSPSSVMNVKALGRHDHLLEPLPNELFPESFPQLAPSQQESDLSDVVPPPPPPETPDTSEAFSLGDDMTDALTPDTSEAFSLGEDVVDVRTSSLDIFAMIEADDSEEGEKDEKDSKQRRRKSRRGQLRRTHSVGAIEFPETQKDGSLTPRRNRRKSVSAERRRSRSGGRKTKRHSICEVSMSKQKSNPTRRNSIAVVATAAGSRRRRSEILASSKGHSPCRRPHSERLNKREESDAPVGKSSSHSTRRRHSVSISNSDHAKHGTSKRSTLHHAGPSGPSKINNKSAVGANRTTDCPSSPESSRRHVQAVAAINFAGTVVSPILTPGSARGKRRTLDLPSNWKDLDTCNPLALARE